jgi:hypothetical protein
MGGSSVVEQYFYGVRVEYHIRGEVPMYLIIAASEEDAKSKARALFAADARHIQTHGKEVISQLIVQATSANRFQVKSVYVEPVQATRLEDKGRPLVHKPDEGVEQRAAERKVCPHTTVTIYEQIRVELNRETGDRRILSRELQRHRYAACIKCHTGVHVTQLGL